MELTFEQELFAREYAHKFCIVGAYIIEEYVKEQTTGDIKIPKFIAEEQAVKTVTDKIQEHLAKGTFEETYAKAWESLKDRLPNDFNATRNLI